MVTSFPAWPRMATERELALSTDITQRPKFGCLISHEILRVCSYVLIFFSVKECLPVKTPRKMLTYSHCKPRYLCQ